MNSVTTPAPFSFTAPTIPTKYPRQELYLNKADSYFKDPAARKKIVDYMVREMYNGAKFYGIDSSLKDPKNWPYIRDFVGEMKNRGVLRVGLAYSDKGSVDRIAAFNASPIHTVNQTQIDNQISEIEPWVSSSGKTWSDLFDVLEYIQSKAFVSKPKLETLSYEGHPNKPDAAQFGNNVKGTILGVDVPCLHCYVFPAPTYPYIRPRLIEFGKQGMLLGYTALKKLPIIPIFSSEQEFSFPFFKKYHPSVAMDALVTAFDADTFPGKECIDFKVGFLMFKASDIMAARP